MKHSNRKLAYICLDATREGKASHAHVHEIIKGLRERGWMVELFQPSYANNATGAPGYIRRVKEFFEMTARVSRNLHNFDCIYIRYHPFSYWIIKAAYKANCPIVLEINGRPNELLIVHPKARLLGPYLQFITKKSFQLSDAFIGVTNELTTLAGQMNNKAKLRTIHNGVNTDIFTPYATTNHKLPENFVVFYGGLAPWQGLKENILPAIKTKYWPENVYLVILGDASKQAVVKTMAAASSKIVILGRLPYREIAGIVNQSICGLVTNTMKGSIRGITELSPLKLYETIACGVPVVVTDYPGQADLVRDKKCGVVIPDLSPSELAIAIQYLYKNPKTQKEMGAIARQVAITGHSWDQRAQATHNFLQNVIQ